jgi:hypothetical protein
MADLIKASSAKPANWIVERIHPFGQDVGSIVPEGFDAYAHVFHPAWRGWPDREQVRWTEIAESTGRVFHAGAQWPHIAFPDGIEGSNELQDPPPDAPWDDSPKEGSLDFEVAGRLVSILSPHTSTPHRCFFAVWDGWGDLRGDARAAPYFELPHRGYFLFEGSIDAATETFSSFEQDSPSAVALTPISRAPVVASEIQRPSWSHYRSAALWWPQDGAWCVATEVDFESTYIGGPRDCIDAVLADPSLEAMTIDIGHGIGWESDTLNPNPLRRST